jgi:hypothetical protein
LTSGVGNGDGGGGGAAAAERRHSFKQTSGRRRWKKWRFNALSDARAAQRLAAPRSAAPLLARSLAARARHLGSASASTKAP